MNNKYSNFLTIILVLIIIAIIGIIGFLAFKYYEANVIKSSSQDFVDNIFNEQVQNNNNIIPIQPEQNEPNEENNENNGNMFEGIEEGNNTTGGNTTSGSSNKPKYNGFLISGTIEIPATGLKCPIIASSEYSMAALDTSVIELYGPGLNKPGVSTISGHNYRNKTFFSDNKKLNIGDKIYITDLTGKKLTYTIYDKFQEKDTYSEYMEKDTQGGIEIALSTCTDDSKARLIILAKADV